MPQTNILFLLCVRKKKLKLCESYIEDNHRGLSMACKQEQRLHINNLISTYRYYTYTMLFVLFLHVDVSKCFVLIQSQMTFFANVWNLARLKVNFSLFIKPIWFPRGFFMRKVWFIGKIPTGEFVCKKHVNV